MNIALQTLSPSPQPPLADKPFHTWDLADGATWTAFHRRGRDYLLRFPDLADFHVAHDGRSVVACPVPDVSAGTLDHLYLNQVLPLALSRQGRLVLHASAVELGGFGVAFSGASGRGKSTLAASFATAGYRFLTDDGLQIEWHDGLCFATPSHPSIRLWQDSQEALNVHDAEHAAPVDYTPKARLLAGDHIAFCDQARPLRRVYFLGDGSAMTLSITPVPPAEALMALVKASFLLDIEERQMLAWHFEEMVRLAALPIYFHLDYPRRYEDLPRVRDAIIDHVAQQNT